MTQALIHLPEKRLTVFRKWYRELHIKWPYENTTDDAIVGTQREFERLRENRAMRMAQSIGKLAFLVILGFGGWPLATFSQGDKAVITRAIQPRDGQHDFDSAIGRWKTHIRRLQNPLTGSTSWVELNGTVVTEKVWGGKAAIEQIEADGAGRHFEGLTLFLYNPESRQWSLNFAASSGGTVSQPAIGEFKDGRGEFYDQETYNGRAIFVRAVWSDVTANSYRFEQSFSDDGGKTWELNFVADVTREKS